MEVHLQTSLEDLVRYSAGNDIDLNAVFGYSVGGQIYNYSRQEYDSDGAYNDRNQMKTSKGMESLGKTGRYSYTSGGFL